MSDGKNINSLNLDNLKQFICNNQNNYQPNTLISFLYFKLNEELSQENHNNNNNIINYNSNKTNLLYELYKCKSNIKKSIILDNFCFEFIKIYKCNCCKLYTYDCTLFNSIHFSLEKTWKYKVNKEKNGFASSINIYDCFNFYFNTLFTYLCNSCNNAGNSLNKMYSLPDFLTIILLRKNNFENDVEFSIDYNIDIKNCLYNSDIRQENTKYQLIGVVSYYIEQKGNYHGSLFKSFKDNNWYFYNGSIVKIVDDIYEMDKGIPYILLYQKIKNYIKIMLI